MTGPSITLSRQAFSQNIERARQLCGPDTDLMLAVKSNAYGHGMDLITHAAVAEEVDALAVLDLPTAVSARTLAPDTPLLAWLFAPGQDYTEAVNAGVHLGVSTDGQLADIARHASSSPAIVHLKVDTGLNRNGATAEQWPALVTQAAELEGQGRLRVHAVWSHLSDTSEESTRVALQRLQDAATVAREAGLTPDQLHLAASHALVDAPEARLDMVRLGILAYGVSPLSNRSAGDLGFHPVLQLHAPVMSVDGDTFTLAVGSGHGLLAPIVAEAALSVSGNFCPVKRVEVDHMVIERPTGVSISAGDSVGVLGRGGVPVEQWATWCGTIGDEVLVHLSANIPRTWAD